MPETYIPSWGFCDSSVMLNHEPDEEHPYYEVETTLVPGEDCRVKDDSDPEKRESIDRSRTKICTKYIPHKPSRYLVSFVNVITSLLV
jgi:hypothetical protein